MGTATLKRTMGRPNVGRPRASQNLYLELYRAGIQDWARLNATRWPLTHYATMPVEFVEEILGEEVAPHQADVLRAIVTNEKVAVRSGTKCGKSKLVIWAALWWYSTRDRARVIMTATVGDQIKRVLWDELMNTVGIARRNGLELEKPGKSPASGMHANDGRQIIGFTARDIESVAGISGPEMLFIVDEASSLQQNFAEAIEGNMAGGNCRMVYISNPVRTEGPFFDAFNSRSKQWALFSLNSEDIAAWNDARKEPIKGLADALKIERWREDYGEDSVFYRVRVKGEFVLNESGKIIDLGTISEAQARHPETPDNEGSLTIGIDPAGPGDGGDETAFAIVRGWKLVALHTFRSLTEDEIVAHARGFLATYRDDNETPRIIVDSEGPIGSALIGKLRGIGDVLRRTRPAEAYEAYGIKASGEARRQPMIYDRTRDELWANVAQWLRDGGAIIPDHMLEAELHTPNFESTLQGRLKVTHKNRIREILGRSPDRADALCLAVWDPAPWLKVSGKRDDTTYETDLSSLPEFQELRKVDTVLHDLDPYAGLDGTDIDPYEG